MDPHSFIARAEAQRWLGIAEKLLMGHDLVGSKTFAIRARDSDPRLEAADQILAITDTLLAADKRIVSNNGTQQPDLYAILQLVRFVQDTDHIASQYRRLAVILNPHQNRFPYADQAFQLVNDAWAVLSNPMRKSMYDADIDLPPQQPMNAIGFNLEQHHHQQHHHHQQQHNFFSINHMGSGHEQELPEQTQTFQTRVQQTHQQQQLQQHNFLSQPNPVRPLPVREQEQLFQHRDQEHIFHPQVKPFQITSLPQQQTRPSPQPPQPQPIQSPPQPPRAASPQPPFSWPQVSPLSQSQQQQPPPTIPQSQSQPKLEPHKQKQHLQPQPQPKPHTQHHLQPQLLPQQQIPQKQSQPQPQPQFPEKKNQQHQPPQPPHKQNQQEPQQQQKQQQLPQEQSQQQPQPQPQQLPEEQSQQQPETQQRPQEQPQQPHTRKQRQQQEQQPQTQRQESLEKNESPGQLPSQVTSDNGVREEEVETETEATTENVDDSPTFWTACPYCFYMYEYPKVYADCTLRCDNCKRAFQAVCVPSPPAIIEGQEACFCCWGFFPLGVSMSDLEKNNGKGTSSSWTPFSPFYDASSNAQDHLNGRAARKEKVYVHKNSGPPIYIDDITDDVFRGISGSSDDSSDADWSSSRKHKVKRMKKGLEHGYKKREQVRVVRARVTRSSVKDMQHATPVQEGVGVGVPVPVTESNKKAVGSNPPRRQSGRIAKELGKLDLNVEFNHNEGEEAAPRVAAGNRGHGQGEEDNIEGIGFFEGLDEFLSSLPILSVVNDEKVKAA